MYFIEKPKGFDFFKRFDYFLFAAVVILSIIGLLVVNSATLTRPDSGSKIMITQIISLIIGLGLSILISTVDYKDFKIFGIILYMLSIILLVIVLFVGTGEDIGSRSWIKLGTISFQPSEVAKISFIIIVSVYLERIYDGNKNNQQNIFKLILFTAIIIALVVAQHDYGTAAVFISILFIMLFVFGLRYKHIIILMSSFLMSSPFIWFFVLNEKRRDRIRVFLDPERDPLGSGFNVLRSKMAIGSGQIIGKGLYQGIQTQNSAVPVKESDFIFSVIGEELGFIGAIIVVFIVFFILLRCIFIAKNSNDSFGAFLAIGVLGMFTVHFIENIGMSIGLLPVTGIPLSFVSAGGSAIVTNYVALGIVLSVSRQKQKWK